MIRHHRPLHDWAPLRRRTSERLAACLTPDLLALRTRRLVADLRERFAVSHTTAMHAVAIARRTHEL